MFLPGTNAASVRSVSAFLICSALLLVPNSPFFLHLEAHSAAKQESTTKPEPGPPAGDLPKLDDVKRQRSAAPEAPLPVESTIRSRKNPLVPWDGRRVGDPINYLTAPSPTSSPQPTATPSVSEALGIRSIADNRLRSAHHVVKRRALAVTPPSITEDYYIQNFFQVALLRQASSAELSYWRDVLRSGYFAGSVILAAQELGRTVFQSGEYEARNTAACDYVRDLYRSYLNREPDQPAWDAWAAYAAGPPEQRENTRHGFEYSNEFYNLMGTLTVGGAGSSSVSSVISARVDLQNQPGSGLLGRSVDWSVPLVSLPGRAGLDLSLSLSCSSQIWTASGPYVYFDEDNGFPSPGFRLGFPTISAQSFDAQVGRKAYVVIDGSGRRVELRQVGTTLNYEAADSSYLLLLDYGSYLLVMTNDGTQMTYNAYNGEWRCTQVKDTNGNYLSASYDSVGHPTTITDTLGRVLTFHYDINSNLLSITQTWSGNQTHTWATFQWASRTLSSNFSGMSVIGIKNSDSISAVTQVGFADGSHYGFDYNGYLQVSAIRHGDSDTVERAYTAYTYEVPPFDSPRLTSSSVSATNWTGINGVPSSVTTSYGIDGSAHKLTAPDGSIYKEFYGTGWQKGLVTQTETWSAGTKVRWTSTSYDQDNTSVNYLTNPRATETNIYDGANHRRTTIDYYSATIPTGTLMKLPSDVKEYLADGTTLYRRTHTDYLGTGDYVNRHMLTLPAATLLYDDNNALASKVIYLYDDGGEFLINTAAAATQHDGSYSTGFTLGRGNVTEVKQYDVTDPTNESKVHTKKIGYDIDGSVIFTRDALNHENAMSYADSFSDNTNRNTFAYPTTLTDADDFSATIKYNFDFGGRTYSAGPPPQGQSQGAIQTITYDSIGRVDRTTISNTGAYTRYVYGPFYVQTFSTINNVADDAYAIQLFDGVGHPTNKASYHPGSSGGYKAELTIYDQMGRAIKHSNPTEINSSWSPAGDDAAGWLYTQQTYDWKGRPLRTTHPDGTYREASYAGCGCAGGEVVTLTDEGTIDGGVAKCRQQKIYSDALGREVKTEVLNWQNGSVYSAIVNTYNARDQITQVRQYAGAEGSGTYQDTILTFDGYSRMQTKHMPEQNAGTATTYSYNADDTLYSSTDARGAVTTYGYNYRHLVRSVSTTLTGSPALSVTSGYDAAGNRTSMSHTVGGVAKDNASFSYNQLSQLTSETRHINALENYAPNYGNFTISYGGYTLSGSLQSVTDPFNSPTNFTYDAIGRTATVTGSFNGTNYTYASSISYRAWGAVSSAVLGGSTETISYNSRLQPTHFALSNTMRYDYSYYDDGKLKTFNDLDDQTGDPHYVYFHYMSRAYYYDQVGRVTSVGQAPNGVIPPFTGNYSYDAFGNLTNRSGQYALNSYQSDGASYTNNRRNGWTYNANGQITASSDTSDSGGSSTRSWTYDAAGKLVTASELRNGQTTTNTLAYDGDGELLYESVNGTVSDYLIRSAVLDTVLTKLTATGGKDITYVPTNGLDAPMQNQNPGYTPVMSWVHREPLGVQDWQSNSAYSSNAYDPFGNLIYNVQPPLSGPPPYVPFYGATWGGASWNSFTNANNFSSGCTLDGGTEDCNKVKQLYNDGFIKLDNIWGSDGKVSPPPGLIDYQIGDRGYSRFITGDTRPEPEPQNTPGQTDLASLISETRDTIKNASEDCAKLLGSDALQRFNSIAGNIQFNGDILVHVEGLAGGVREGRLSEVPPTSGVTVGDQIYLNPSGWAFAKFYNFPDINKHFADVGATDQHQYALATIIHEFLHTTGKFKADSVVGLDGRINSKQSEKYQKEVLKKCFSKR